MARIPTDAELLDAIRKLKVICAGIITACIVILYGMWMLFRDNSLAEFAVCWVCGFAMERICWRERMKLKWIIDAIGR